MNLNFKHQWEERGEGTKITNKVAERTKIQNALNAILNSKEYI